MSDAGNKALARRWLEEVWNQGSEASIDELFHPQGKAYGFPDPDWRVIRVSLQSK